MIRVKWPVTSRPAGQPCSNWEAGLVSAHQPNCGRKPVTPPDASGLHKR
jgi:hypothetical protein